MLLQLNRKSFHDVGLPQVLALFEAAPTTESRRNLFCLIFDAEVAQEIEVRHDAVINPLCNVCRLPSI